MFARTLGSFSSGRQRATPRRPGAEFGSLRGVAPEGGSSVRYTYTLRNKDTDDLYVLDPDKMTVRLFRFFQRGPFLLSTRDHRGFQGDVDLPGPFTPPGQLDMAWFSLLRERRIDDPDGDSSGVSAYPAGPVRLLLPLQLAGNAGDQGPARTARRENLDGTGRRELSLNVGPGESTAGSFELRIAPRQDEVAPAVTEKYTKALAEGQVPADSQYLWVPARPGTNLGPI